MSLAFWTLAIQVSEDEEVYIHNFESSIDMEVTATYARLFEIHCKYEWLVSIWFASWSVFLLQQAKIFGLLFQFTLAFNFK